GTDDHRRNRVLHRDLLRAGRAVSAGVSSLIRARNGDHAAIGLVSVTDPTLHWLGCAVIADGHLAQVRRRRFALAQNIRGASDDGRSRVSDQLSTIGGAVARACYFDAILARIGATDWSY